MAFQYKPEILDELQRYGITPEESTDPQDVRDLLNDLYRRDIRALKERLLKREFPQTEYADRVRELRKNYILLSIPLRFWTRDA
jgi:hypothetical protein